MSRTGPNPRQGDDAIGSAKLLSQFIEELIELERRGAAGELDERERRRWRQLSRDLLGVPETLGEKRRFIRVRLSQAARLLAETEAEAETEAGAAVEQDAEARSQDDEAQVLSLSAGGLFVETQRQLSAGDQIAVAVELPRPERVRLTLRGEVRWVCGRDGGRHGAGVRFVDLDDDQRLVITQLVRDELLRDLHLAIEKYRFFFEASPDATLLVDRAGRVRELNDRARLAFAIEGEQPFDAVLDALDADSREGLLAAMEAVKAVPPALDGSTVERCEVGVAPRDGRPEQLLELLLTPVRAAQIKLGVLIVGRDVTAQRGLERQRRYLEEQLRQADKLATLGRIAAGVAHDINNPLAWISSNLQQLGAYREPIGALITRALGGEAAEPDPMRLREIERELTPLLRETGEGGQRLRQIALDLRGLARLEQDDPEPVHVNEVLEATLRMLDRQLRGRATVVRELDPSLPPTRSHFGKLAQIFLNLLTNAGRAFDRADPRQNVITVRSSFDADADAIVVVVEDTGAGIPPELSSRVFDPLFSTRQAVGGAGLGLSIAKDAARDLDASLALDSELGRGSRFTLRLPLQALEEREHAAPVETLPLPGRPRLLIVDDEVLLLRSLTRYLARFFDVVAVESVSAVAEQLEQELPMLVLCDVMMPDDGGRAVYALVCEHDPELARRIVFMTGGTFEPGASSFLDGLENRVLPKPLDLNRLMRCLGEVVAEAVSVAVSS